MIEQSNNMSVLNEKPFQAVNRKIRIIGYSLSPFIRFWRNKKHVRTNDRILPDILNHIQLCQNRTDLEKFIGKPKYIISGEYFSCNSKNKTIISDIVEHYEHKGCEIKLWFKNKRLIHITGSVLLTVWDRVAGLSGEIDSIKKKKKHQKALQYLPEGDEKKLLVKELNLDSFNMFLETYFPECSNPADKDLIAEIYAILHAYEIYSQISDLKEILLKTKKARFILNTEYGFDSVAMEFLMLLAIIHPEICKKTHLLAPLHVKSIEKLKHLIES